MLNTTFLLFLLIHTFYFSATDDYDIAEKKEKKDDDDDSPDDPIPYPKQIFFIISMETYERFSYYGMNSK